MFRFLHTENDLDEFIARVPDLSGFANELQCVQESEHERILAKRVVCISELHCAHEVDDRHVDLRCELNEGTRVYFSALNEITDDFVKGSIDPQTMVDRCENVRLVVDKLLRNNDEIKRIYECIAAFPESGRNGLLYPFDAKFIRMMATEFVSRQQPPHDEHEQENHHHASRFGA